MDAIPPLMGLLIFFGMLSPSFRHKLETINQWLPLVLIVATVLFIGFAIYRISRNKYDDTAPSSPSNWSSPSTASWVNPQLRTVEKIPTLGEKLKIIDWFQFEKLVEIVFRHQGYTVTRRGGANADGGIDLVIEKNGERTAVQCKHWKAWDVGVAKVRELVGAMTDAGIPKGMLITMSGYTGDARTLADRNRIEIKTEAHILEMLESVDAKFNPEVQALLTDTRKFCPKCESEMVLRTASKGPNVGKQFWGCSRYPACRFTMELGT